MEGTILQSFIRGCRLRAWLSRPDCPQVIKACKAFFQKYFPTNPPYQSDEEQEDVTSGTVSRTPDDLRPLIHTHEVLLKAHWKHEGANYSRSSTHLGNSLIEYYRDGSKSSPPVPGSIKYIYQHEGRVYFAVQRHRPAPREVCDPFRHYPDFPAKLYLCSFVDRLEAVKADWVFGHVARWQFSPESVVVVSLSRVSCCFLLSHILTNDSLELIVIAYCIPCQ